jgi:RNA polymerase sigma-70 factor (ECF subfamily)
MKGGEHLNEAVLIEKLKNHNEHALELIIKQYGGYVYTIVHNILSSMTSQDVEETVADVFIKLWNHSEYLDKEKPIKPYIIGIARNTAKNKLREQTFTVSLEDDELFLNCNPEEEVERKEVIEIIKEVLQNMKPEDRTIFIRYYYNYEKIRDISISCKLSESAVKMKLHRIRKVLQETLTERGYAHES